MAKAGGLFKPRRLQDGFSCAGCDLFSGVPWDRDGVACGWVVIDVMPFAVALQDDTVLFQDFEQFA